MSEMRNKLIDI